MHESRFGRLRSTRTLPNTPDAQAPAVFLPLDERQEPAVVRRSGIHARGDDTVAARFDGDGVRHGGVAVAQYSELAIVRPSGAHLGYAGPGEGRPDEHVPVRAVETVHVQQTQLVVRVLGSGDPSALRGQSVQIADREDVFLVRTAGRN
jgi:hypothetical protein